MRVKNQYCDDAYCAEHGREVQDFLEIINVWDVIVVMKKAIMTVEVVEIHAEIIATVTATVIVEIIQMKD